MNYTTQIPEVFQSNENLKKLSVTLDGIEAFKKGLVEKSVRLYRPPLLSDLKWLRKKVEDYGYPRVPEDFKKDQLDAMLLNAQHVMALRGSKMGLKFFLWVLTFGNITVDDSLFYPQADYIVPSDEYYGYLSHFDPLQTYDLYLFSGVSNFGTQILNITIETKYHYMSTLRNYIQTHIRSFLNFTDDNVQINITYLPGVYNTYAEPYQYFVT